MTHTILNAPGLVRPKGYSHAVKTTGGTTVYLAGQTGMDAAGRIAAPGDLVAQFGQALANLRLAVEHAGGTMSDVARLTIYVTDGAAYRASLEPLGEAYRSIFGRYYPAMTLVEVKGLFDDEALVEVEAIAVLAEHSE